MSGKSRLDELLESRRPKNGAERLFHERAEANGWRVTRRGWPDFFCWNEDGNFFAVEIKRPRQRLKKHQAAVLQILADHGIPAYRWDPRTGFTSVRPRNSSRARGRGE